MAETKRRLIRGGNKGPRGGSDGVGTGKLHQQREAVVIYGWMVFASALL